ACARYADDSLPLRRRSTTWSLLSFYLVLAQRPPRPPLFPYTTLFRSQSLGPHRADRRLGRTPHRDSVLHERVRCPRPHVDAGGRSEEHTSELQSRFDLVCRLLLEKKKFWLGDAASTNMQRAHSSQPEQ